MRTSAPPRRALAAVSLALLALPAVASAQCDAGADAGPDPSLDGVLRDVFPAADAVNVPTDTAVRLRYLGRPPEPPTLCVRVRSGGSCLQGSAAVVGHEIVWSPQGGQLPSFTDFTVTYADIAGGSVPFTFRTGSGPSAGPPVFDGIEDVTARDAEGETCEVGAVDVTVTFTRAISSSSGAGLAWPDSDVEYVIFQTRGPGISGPRVRDRVRLQRSGASSDRSAQRTFRLSAAEADGPVCFAVQAYDPLGRSAPNTQESCANPAQGNYFQSCAARPWGRAGSAWWAAVMAAAAIFFARRHPLARRREGL